jgi:hypothetical protein
MNDVWIRRRVGWSPQGGATALNWALWQPRYAAQSWPTEEMRPAFVYYACEDLKAGGRGVVARATVTAVLPPTEVDSPDAAYALVADRMFDEHLTVERDSWHANAYNRTKAMSPWPQRVTAWRVAVEPVGPHLVPELARFPHSGWLRTNRIGL